MEEVHDRVESDRRYRTLLRSLARGEPAPRDLPELLAVLGREPRELERDLEAWRARARLAARAESAADLLDRAAIAREGYLLIRQASQRARDEAEQREARARASYEALAQRAAEAHAADAELKALLPLPLRSAWEAAARELDSARDRLRATRLAGRNCEHAEAALEAARSAYERARQAALEA